MSQLDALLHLDLTSLCCVCCVCCVCSLSSFVMPCFDNYGQIGNFIPFGMTSLDTGAKLVRKTVDGKELDLKDKEGEVFCRVVRAFPAPLVSTFCLLLSLLSLCLACLGALTVSLF